MLLEPAVSAGPLEPDRENGHDDIVGIVVNTWSPLVVGDLRSPQNASELTDGRVSQKSTNLALRALVRAGLVLVEAHPPANLYRLNRQHLDARGIEELASLRARLLEAMTEHIRNWAIPSKGAWMFGSAARGDGDEASDIDVLVLRPDPVELTPTKLPRRTAARARR